VAASGTSPIRLHYAKRDVGFAERRFIMALDNRVVEIQLLLKSGQYEAAIAKVSEMTGGVGKAAEKDALGGIMNLQAGAVWAGQKIGEAFKWAAGQIMESIQMASQYEEVHSKLNTVFSSISSQAQNMANQLKNAYGLSGLEAEKLLAATGDLLVGFDFSETAALELSGQVQKLSVDLASFQNLEGGAARASEIITKAMLGERDALVSLGVKIGEAELKEKALAMGFKVTAGEISKQAKAQATLALIMDQSKKAVGDFARTQDSFANQTKILQGHLQDLQVELGKKLMPVFEPFIKDINSAFEGKKDLNSATTGLIGTYKSYKEVTDQLKDSTKKLTKEEAENLKAKQKLLKMKLVEDLKEVKKQYEQYSKEIPLFLLEDPLEMTGKYIKDTVISKYDKKGKTAYDWALEYYNDLTAQLNKMDDAIKSGQKTVSSVFESGGGKFKAYFNTEFNANIGNWDLYFKTFMKKIDDQREILQKDKASALNELNAWVSQYSFAIEQGYLTLEQLENNLRAQGMKNVEDFIGRIKSYMDGIKNVGEVGDTGNTGGEKEPSAAEKKLELLKAQYSYYKMSGASVEFLNKNLREQEAVLMQIRQNIQVDSIAYYKNTEEILKIREEIKENEKSIEKTGFLVAKNESKRLGILHEEKETIGEIAEIEKQRSDELKSALDRMTGYMSTFVDKFGEGNEKAKKVVETVNEMVGIFQSFASGDLIGGIFGVLMTVAGGIIDAIKGENTEYERQEQLLDQIQTKVEKYQDQLNGIRDALSQINNLYSDPKIQLEQSNKLLEIEKDKAEKQLKPAQSQLQGIFYRELSNYWDMQKQKGMSDEELSKIPRYKLYKDMFNSLALDEHGLIADLPSLMDAISSAPHGFRADVQALIDQLIGANGDLAATITQLNENNEALARLPFETQMEILQAQEAYLKASGEDYNANLQSQIDVLTEQLEIITDETERYQIMTEIANLRKELEESTAEIIDEQNQELEEQIKLIDRIRELTEGAAFDTENLWNIRQAMTEYQRQGYSQAQAARELSQIGVKEQIVDQSKTFNGLTINISEAQGDTLDEATIGRRAGML